MISQDFPGAQAGPAARRSPLPRRPVLDWSSFALQDAAGIESVEALEHSCYVTSGRAAIYHALQQMHLPKGSVVLVPTYHCPTMVAPVLLAQLEPAYFGIDAQGSPQLDGIDEKTVAASKAIIVPHYFGLPRSLARVRQWCDTRGIALIEDCAHSYFGKAGDRPVGAWGDYATASLSKFFPVPEAGLLASARHPLEAFALSRAGVKAQTKGWVDVFELAASHGKFFGVNALMSLLFRLKNSRAPSTPGDGAEVFSTDEAGMMRDCDMGRIQQTPLQASMALKAMLPRGTIIRRRQDNFAIYEQLFADVEGARPLLPSPVAPTAPYVFPLWVDDADRVYRAVRTLALPVFRWDRIWPGTPVLAGDAGPSWSRHVLQLLCHQDLSPKDARHVAESIRDLLPASAASSRKPYAH